MNKEAKSFFRYPGGKSRLAKQIFNIIEGKVDLNTVNSYIEPFIGGGSIFNFAFIMTVGILLGTLSSLYIAPPLLLFMVRKEEQNSPQ